MKMKSVIEKIVLATMIAVMITGTVNMGAMLCDTQYGASQYFLERGAKDDVAPLAEQCETDEELMGDIRSNWYSESVIRKFLADGRLTGYVDVLKSEGWLSADYGTSSSTSSSSASADTSTKESTETSESAADTTAQPKAKAEDKTAAKTKAETKAAAPTYTQEQIDAAWKETSRTDATCTTAGTVGYTNSLTGDTKSDTIDALGHDYKSAVTTPATCTTDGVTTYTCTRCGDSYTEPIKATGHKAGDWTVTVKPTWFAEGTEQQVCTVCGSVIATKSIPQTCPLPLAGVIGIVAGGAVLIAGIAVGIVKRKAIKEWIGKRKAA